MPPSNDYNVTRDANVDWYDMIWYDMIWYDVTASNWMIIYLET